MYFGDMFDAARAHELHIVNKVVPADEVLAAAKEWAAKLAQKPPVALQMLKVAVNAGSNTDMETGLTIENTCFGNAFSTEDRKEGLTAFVEKESLYIPDGKGEFMKHSDIQPSLLIFGCFFLHLSDVKSTVKIEKRIAFYGYQRS